MLKFKTNFVFLSFVTSLHINVGTTKINEYNRMKRQDENSEFLVNDDVQETTEPIFIKPDLYSSNLGSSLEMPEIRQSGVGKSVQKCKEYIAQIEPRFNRAATLKRRNGSASDEFLRVAGGHDSLPSEFPHMAAIGWEKKTGSYAFKCGGSLISEKFVLSAGHCTYDTPHDDIVDRKPKIVRLGYFDITDKTAINEKFYTDVKITKITAHPQYKAPIKYFDIALFELEKAQDFSDSLRPACLWNNVDTSSLGTKALVTGWGSVDPDTAEKTTTILQVAKVDIIDSKKCDLLLHDKCGRNWCGVKQQLCAGKLAGGVDTCEGDSGGPLQINIPLPIPTDLKMYYIVGVTSFGGFSHKCAMKDSPGVYMEVASFVNWIETVVWP